MPTQPDITCRQALESGSDMSCGISTSDLTSLLGSEFFRNCTSYTPADYYGQTATRESIRHDVSSFCLRSAWRPHCSVVDHVSPPHMASKCVELLAQAFQACAAIFSMILLHKDFLRNHDAYEKRLSLPTSIDRTSDVGRKPKAISVRQQNIKTIYTYR